MNTTVNRSQVVITNGDSYIGHVLACHFVKEAKRHGERIEGKLRVTCRNAKDLSKLREEGVDVVEVSYDDKEKLRRAFRDVEYAVIVPEMSKNRVREGENTIEAIKQENVKHTLLLSCIGADSEHKYMQDYLRLEKYLDEMIKNNKWVIFRIDFIQQLFYLWAPMIERERRIALPIGQHGKFAPVCIFDVADAVLHVVCNRQRHHGDQRDESRPGQKVTETVKSALFSIGAMDERHHKQKYSLTGPDTLSGKGIAESLSETLDERIEFAEISRAEMKKYLERVAKEDYRFQTPVDDDFSPTASRSTLSVDADKNRGRNNDSDRNRGRPHGIPRGIHLTETKIESLLDFFECVKDGKVDFATGDLREFLNRDPEDITEFFRRNRDEFRSRSESTGRCA